ncbi:EAL domain-containing protein [Paenibacillus sp. MWE-103]|uniref:EAL domain-containing protein n=1 Tax=Paenibacillus artemisiicola TaxID=1172618 RepID=A0ABS3WDJ1_9BACL|nr:EAL domain-containing protein [Paenibacillus artemisiicola]MBO7746377.1 EAL domain-containing protein [Paenibacillus artemisiicola]
MFYDGHLLLMLVPILFLFHASVVIFRRNPAGPENRAACMVTLLLLLLFILDFAQLIVPHSAIRTLTAAAKYPAMLLAAGAGFCLHVVFTRNYHRIPPRAGIAAALLPFAGYMLQLALSGPSAFIARVDEHGHWTREAPTAALGVYLSAGCAFMLLNAALAIMAWRRSDARFDRSRFLALLRTDLVYLAAAAALAVFGALVGRHALIPSTYMLLPGLAWSVALSLMMINSDFLPRLSRRYEVLFQMSPAPILIVDAAARIRDANPKAREMFGLRGEPGQAEYLEPLFAAEDRELFREMYASYPDIRWHSKELAMRGADGQPLSVLLDMETMAENGEPYGIAIIRDITQRKSIERRTDYLARHDLLTGLPNRSAFKRSLDEAMASKNDAPTFDAVLLVDLDRFKLINDTLGHQCGDDVLKIISGRFRDCLGEEHLLARAGGDEFMLLVRGAAEFDEIIRVAERMQGALEAPVFVLGGEYYTTASIGISLFPGDGATADAIIKNADIAMYHAKSNGGSQYRFYSKELNASIKRMVDMEASLRRALEENEFYVVYQPQTDIASGRTIGAEALVRWNSKAHGRVSPADFIPLAEQSGLILKLGQWVLEEACREAKRWEQAGWTSLKISVNVSAKQFKQPDFADVVKDILKDTGLDPRKLCIEITESVVIDKLMFTLKMLDELVALGVEISIDDFGTGYSSLSLLRQLPISVIKIDQSFIAEMVEVQSVRSVVAAMITMSHHLGKTVVAEGIESEQQMAWLREMGCDNGQGYFIDKPLTAELMRARLKNIS